MEKRITKPIKELLSVMAVLSILLVFVSCTFSGNAYADKRIMSDSPWYNAEITEVNIELNENKQLVSLYQQYAGSDDKNIIVLFTGRYKTDDNKGSKRSDREISKIAVIDRTTKSTIKTIDLIELLSSFDNVKSASYAAGILTLRASSIDEKTGSVKNKDYDVDIDTLKVLSVREEERNYNSHFSDCYIIGQYKIETIYNSENGRFYYTLRVFTPDGNILNIDIRETDKDIYDIPVILSLSETTVLVPVAMERDYKFYKVDLEKSVATVVDANNYAWLDIEQMKKAYSETNGTSYITTPDGIVRADMNSKTMEKVFDYSWCNINRSLVSRLEICNYTDDSILLCGRYLSSNMFVSNDIYNFAIVEFTKTKGNPHAGKLKLELYVSDEGTNEIIYDAITKFNETNKKCYINISDRYNTSSFYNYYGKSSNDELESAKLEGNSKLSNTIAMDIMNGEGPDLLLNTSELGQLNNENYLVDLLPYFSDLDENLIFTNIINGSKTDGKLFQLPISFTLEGIQTDPNCAGKTGVGFTTEEYKAYLQSTLNGKDVIDVGQSYYFVKLLNGMGEVFVNNGKVDFSNPEFLLLADYVKENVQQKSISWNTNDTDGTDTINNRIAYYSNCPGISGYLVKRDQIKNGTAILGIPSSDGRGPMFGSKISVAISKNCVDKKSCIEFVKTLISDEIQLKLVMNDQFVINRDAFRQGCNAAIEYYNTEDGSQNLFDYAAGTYVTSHMKFTSEDIDRLENVILSCSKSDTEDSAINLILIEEMPAYFLGQKNLDSVVKIAQNRAQKVLDERG